MREHSFYMLEVLSMNQNLDAIKTENPDKFDYKSIKIHLHKQSHKERQKISNKLRKMYLQLLLQRTNFQYWKR